MVLALGGLDPLYLFDNLAESRLHDKAIYQHSRSVLEGLELRLHLPLFSDISPISIISSNVVICFEIRDFISGSSVSCFKRGY